MIGVNVVESFGFPFKVAINIGNIGGPSAGMMFALAIIDKLTPANLTGGKFIAGTGEIEVDGKVDPIGGIQQKMAAARAAGATDLPDSGFELRRYGRRGARRASSCQSQNAERRARRRSGRSKPVSRFLAASHPSGGARWGGPTLSYGG